MRKAIADVLHMLSAELNTIARYLMVAFVVVFGYLGVAHLRSPDSAPKADPPAIQLPPLDVPAEREIAKQGGSVVPEKVRPMHRVAQYRIVTEDVSAEDPSMSEVRRLMHGDRPAPQPAPVPVDRVERRSSMPIAAPVVVHQQPRRFEREQYRPPVRRAAPPPYCPPHMRRHARRMGPPPRRRVRFQDMYRERQPRGYRVVRPGHPYPPARPNYPVRAYGGVPPWVVVR